MNNTITIILVQIILLIYQTNAYFEVKLIRQAKQLEINVSEVLTGIEISKCPVVFSEVQHNTSFSPQICFS